MTGGSRPRVGQHTAYDPGIGNPERAFTEGNLVLPALRSTFCLPLLAMSLELCSTCFTGPSVLMQPRPKEDVATSVQWRNLQSSAFI